MLCGMQEIARFLAAHPPFDALPAEVLEQTAATVEVGRYPRGARILRQRDQPSRYLYVVVQGLVELRQAVDGGGWELVETLAEGETFGELIGYEATVGPNMGVPATEVPDALIAKILQAGVCAANGGNTQRWRFLVVKDQAIKKKVQVWYKRAFDEVVGPRYLKSSPPPGGDRYRGGGPDALILATASVCPRPGWLLTLCQLTRRRAARLLVGLDLGSSSRSPDRARGSTKRNQTTCTCRSTRTSLRASAPANRSTS